MYACMLLSISAFKNKYGNAMVKSIFTIHTDDINVVDINCYRTEIILSQFKIKTTANL